MAADWTPRVRVIVPTYNERENLRTLATAVLALPGDFSLLIVDDNSPDGTGAIADTLATEYAGRIAVLHRARKEGIGPAYVAGFRWALGTDADVIVTMDADLSHDPADLPRVIAALVDADLALGSRYVAGGGTHGWPWFRKAISRGGGIYARLVLGVDVADLTGGFKAYRREALAALDLDHLRSDGYGFQIETVYRTLKNGFRVREIPILFHDRTAGQSKLSRRIVLEAMVMVWRLRLERG